MNPPIVERNLGRDIWKLSPLAPQVELFAFSNFVNLSLQFLFPRYWWAPRQPKPFFYQTDVPEVETTIGKE
jgi:hypothetical protein